MTTLRNLSVSLTMNSAQFRKEVNKVDRRFKQLSRSARTWNRSMVRSVGVLSAAVGGLSLKRLIKESIDAGDRANKFSQQIGVATETITGLELAADLAGVGMRDVEVGMRRLGRAMSDAKAGLSTQVRAFQDLGISATDSAGNLRPVDDVLRELSDKFSEMPDGARKVARAQELLGRSGSLLIPMLNGGAKGIESQIELSRELGLVWSKEAAKGAELFNDQLHILKKAGQGVATTFAKQLLPGLNRQLARMIEFVKENRVEIVKWAKRGIVVATGFMTAYVGKMMLSFTWTMANAAIALPALIKQWVILKGMKLIGFFKDLGESLKKLNKRVLLFAAKALAIVTAVYAVSVVIRGVIDANKDLGNTWATVWDTLKRVVGSVGDFIVAKMKKTFISAINSLKGFANIAIAAINKFRDNPIDPFQIDTDTVSNLQSQIDAAKAVIAEGMGDLKALGAEIGGDYWAEIKNTIMSDMEFIKGLPEQAMSALGSALDSVGSMMGLGGNTDDQGESGEGAGIMPSTTALPTTLANEWEKLKNGFGEGMQPVLESFDNLGQKISTVFTDALTGVTSLKDGLLSVAKAIGTSVINAFINMGIEWVATQLMMKKMSMASQAASVGTAVAQGAAIASAMTPAAVMTSLATMGANSGPAIAGMTAAKSVGTALALGQFHDGIDDVPSTGTYLLEKGERVVDGRLNGDLKEFLANPQNQSNVQPITLNVNGVSDPDIVVEALSERRGELESMLRRITSDNLGQRP